MRNCRKSIFNGDCLGNTTVFQVKSSDNNFGKSIILDLLTDLTNDVPEAVSFRLSLIGTVSGDTKNFINGFNANTVSKLGSHTPLLGYQDKIKIDIDGLNLDALDGNIQSRVSELLSKHNILVPYPVIKLVSLGLQAQFTRFATDGRKVTRKELTKDILDWMSFNYRKELQQEKDKLSLAFYINKTIVVTSTFEQQLMLPAVSTIPDFASLQNECLELIEQITTIKLSHRPQMPNAQSAYSFLSMRLYDAASGTYSADLSTEQISRMKHLSSIFLGRELPSDFFNVGSVSKTPLDSAYIFLPGPRYTGTADEVKKRELLDDLIRALNVLSDIDDLWSDLLSYRIIPLVLINDSDRLHEHIELHLMLPSDVKVLHTGTFPVPDYVDNLEFLSFEKRISVNHFVLKQDSLVKPYDHRRNNPMKSPVFNLLHGRGREEYENFFNATLAWIFDYKIYHDIPGVKTMVCDFQSLKPKDKWLYLHFYSSRN